MDVFGDPRKTNGHTIVPDQKASNHGGISEICSLPSKAHAIPGFRMVLMTLHLQGPHEFNHFHCHGTSDIRPRVVCFHALVASCAGVFVDRSGYWKAVVSPAGKFQPTYHMGWQRLYEY